MEPVIGLSLKLANSGLTPAKTRMLQIQLKAKEHIPNHWPVLELNAT